MNRMDDDRFHVAEFADPVVTARFSIDLQNYLEQPGMQRDSGADDAPLEVLGPPPGAMAGRNACNELYLSDKALKAANAANLTISIAREITRRELPPNLSVLLNF